MWHLQKFNICVKMDKYVGADFVFGGPPCQGFSVAGKKEKVLGENA